MVETNKYLYEIKPILDYSDSKIGSKYTCVFFTLGCMANFWFKSTNLQI